MFRNLSPELLGISGRQSEVIETALSHGFRGIDLNIVELHEQAQAWGLVHARRLLDSAKLKFGGFPLPMDLADDEAEFRTGLARLGELAATSAQVGCTRVVGWIEPASDLRPMHENFEFHRKRLADVGKLLAAHGLSLGLGFRAGAAAGRGRAFQFIQSFDALQMLVDMSGAANIGFVLDAWNLHVSGGALEGWRKLPVARIVSVLLADAREGAEPAPEERLLPGETGVIDCPAVLVRLAEIGYAGPVTPAPHPSQFTGERREAIVKRTGQKLDEVWKAAGLSATGKLTAPAQHS
jgi:sugar phosphate isomerase/epimerase